MLSIPHCLFNRLTDGSEVVSSRTNRALLPRNIYYFCLRYSLKKNVYRLLVGKPEGKRPLGRPRCRWIDNIKMDLLEIGVSVVDWIGLAQIGTGGELL
jgi:hypothetical protein